MNNCKLRYFIIFNITKKLNRQIKGIIFHPNYKKQSSKAKSDFDICLLRKIFKSIHTRYRFYFIIWKNFFRYEKPFSFNQYVKPISMPSSCTPAGTMCNAIGSGNTMSSTHASHRWQSLDKPILSDRVCHNSYPGHITETMICAGYLEGDKGTVSFNWNIQTDKIIIDIWWSDSDPS